MASLRLTIEHGRVLVEQLITHRFGKQHAELKKELDAFTKKVYADLFSSDFYLFAKKHRDWFPTRSELLVGFGARREGLISGTPTVYFSVPQCFAPRHSTIKLYEANHPLSEEWVKLSERRETLEKEVDAARAQAKGTISNFNTDVQLIAAWPEIKPFVDKLPRPSKVTALAVPTKDLNAAFKLPVKK